MEEALLRLERFGSTVISVKAFKSFNSNPDAVVKFLESKGFCNCSCRAIPDEYINAEGTIERSVTVIISGKPKKRYKMESYKR